MVRTLYSCAAYAAEGILTCLVNKPVFASPYIQQLFHYRGGFTLHLPPGMSRSQQEHDLLISAIIGKIAQRGIPAPCSLNIERYVLQEAEKGGILKYKENNNVQFQFIISFADQQLIDCIVACLFPELLISDQEVCNLFDCYRRICTTTEYDFFRWILDKLPEQRLGLFIIPQRLFHGLGVKEHFNQRVDFVIEIPYSRKEGWLKIAIELDDASHSGSQQYFDALRNEALRKAGWKRIRYSGSGLMNSILGMKKLKRSPLSWERRYPGISLRLHKP